MARTDIHRPGHPDFDPTAYTAIGTITLSPSFTELTDMHPAAREYRLRMLDWMQAHPKAAHQPDGTCGHCGHYLNHALILRHEPTREWITVGGDCAERFHMTKREYEQFRDREIDRGQRARRHEAMVNRDSRLAILCDEDAAAATGNGFLVSLAHQAMTRDLTENQIVKALEAIERDARRATEQAAERETRTDAPEGRMVITGTVLKLKEKDTQFGTVLKMVLKDDRGFVVWSSVPAAIVDDVNEGDRIVFTGTLERSQDDSTFAFASRPSKASIIEEAVPLQAELVTA